MSQQEQMIIFTDLDGTLLDAHDYSLARAVPALRAAQQRKVPIVFCSSKTRAEIEIIQKQSNVHSPFIVENGSAIYLPLDYFPYPIANGKGMGSYTVLELGTPYPEIVQTFQRLRHATSCQMTGFSDMTAAEIAADSGLTLPEAIRAKAREYSEPFRFTELYPARVEAVLQRIVESGLRFSIGGRYHHLHGNTDKGRAVRILSELFGKADEIFTVGLGDSLNDLPMLREVQQPVLVRKPHGLPCPDMMAELPGIRLTQGIGPEGWCEAVLELLAERYGV